MNEQQFDRTLDIVKFIIPLAARPSNRNADGPNWDYVCADLWAEYPGVLNEFLINDAIDMLYEFTEISND